VQEDDKLVDEPVRREYAFLDWSGDSGFKFDLGSSSHLGLCVVSSANYGRLRFKFHFVHNSNLVRAAFFASLPHLPWQASALIVNKRDLPLHLHAMPAPSFYGFFVAHVMAIASLETISVRRLLVDDRRKQSATIRAIRIAFGGTKG
jgi:hypothetical protein